MTTDAVINVSQEWASACDVQQAFMHCPASTVEAVSYGARCRQLRELGGDCYDFLPLPGNRLAVAIGDASGKSLPAALMISSVQSCLRTAASFLGSEPSAVLKTVNRQVHTASLADRFATLFCGVDGFGRLLHSSFAVSTTSGERELG
jgi:sigma-B regulation protein RsbU (phosphoserine phosphatase)